MVYTERAETAAVSRAMSSLVDIQKRAIKKKKKRRRKRCRITRERSESARERRIALYKSDQHIDILQLSTFRLPSVFSKQISKVHNAAARLV